MPDMRQKEAGVKSGNDGVSFQQSDVFSFLWGVYSSVAEFCPNHNVPGVVGLTDTAKQELIAATQLLDMDPRESHSLSRPLQAMGTLPRKFLPPGHPKEYYWQYLATRGMREKPLQPEHPGATPPPERPGASPPEHLHPGVPPKKHEHPGVPAQSQKTPRTGLQHASYTVFKRAWRSHFKQLLGFTRFHKHAICNTCSELKAKMRTASTATERICWAKQYDQHQDDQMQDRLVYYRAGEAGRKGEFLCMIIDGSDQAKYRIVRTTRAPKEFDGLYCPRMKLLGSLCHGVVGCFWLIEDDVKESGPDVTVEALMST